jgi:amidohydrolase
MENSHILTLIQDKAKELHNEILNIREHIHMNPELSFQEKETSSFIASKLESCNIPYTNGWAGYGIVAVIKGEMAGKNLGLRGDMDALPIQESNEVAYKSKNPGIMHACGHDVHTSCLLGAAMILQSIKKYIKGNIILIFQPGEEKLPGGAGMMIKEGVVEKYQMDAIIAQHVYPSMETGNIGVRSGLYMASADEIYITVKGKGGHAAMPQECIDTILMASQVLVNLQQIVSRNAPPAVPSVLSFGKIKSDGGTTNVIPDKVFIEGTFRTMDETWRKKAHSRISEIVEETVSSFGGTCEVRIETGYPCLINDPDLTGKVKTDASRYLGEKHVEELPLRMTSEDFSFFSQHLPATFYRLGTGNKSKGIVSPVHTSNFDVDADALRIGSGLMAWIAYNRINEMSE